jgi:hypothetical protein
LRQVELFGSSREGAGTGNCDESLQFIPFHNQSYKNNEFVLFQWRSYHGPL